LQHLTQATSYPIVTTCPGLVATFCSLVFFGEIKGPRNLCFLGLAWIVTFAGVRAPCNKI
jgi:hypothetical protein